MAIAATMRPRIATNCLPVSAHQFDAAVGEDPGGRCKANSVTAVEVVVQVLIFFGVHCDNAHWLSDCYSSLVSLQVGFGQPVQRIRKIPSLVPE